ncbi:hypothetical protein CDCA_CDCA06G1887 [Cyanidium caldarium]|uniref:Electron transfer flavoprotein subunit beta n=1 Tax=Cyanidium caldarium TaxID=2771 RepID=A0AAV9IU66_CYACA|nr:hypothetical protein CDCA_CDCA06G1887 [Cyanidium caldarium]
MNNLRILVAVKRVIDYAVRVRVKPDGSGVDVAHVKMSMNPFCEIAVEEAIRIRERLGADRVRDLVAVTVGPEANQETLRTALAMGMDRGIHVVVPETAAGVTGGSATPLEPLAVAQALQRVADRESAQLIVLGKQAIDDDCNQTGQLLAARLNWPQGTFASAVALDWESPQGATATVTREVDAGLETVRLRLPCVITCDLRLNTPRYATLPNIMKAKKKPIERLTLQELEVDPTPRYAWKRVSEPSQRRAGVMVSDVNELLTRLRADGCLPEN